MLQLVRRGLERMLSAQRLMDAGVFHDRLAHERALALLVRALSPAQRAEFERSNTFTVRGGSGQRYRITFGTTANVEVLDPTGAVTRRLCAAPTGVPVPAAMLAQKLMLEASEAEFLAIAARGPGTTVAHPIAAGGP
jgi:hypothetical protein